MTVIALFGATGKTGRLVLERALTSGYDVRALVRDPTKLAPPHERLTIVQGHVLDAVAVERAIAGSDAVLSLFGHVKDSPPTLQTDGTGLIVAAMKKHGVTRLVPLAGGGLRAPQDRPKASDKVIRTLLKVLAGDVLADAEGHLTVLETSGLDWTVVRGPRLTEEPGEGRYRVGWVGVDASTRISRHDLADFILTQVDDRRFVHQLPFVSD